MEQRTREEQQRHFARGVLVLGGALTVLFAAEFLAEYWRLGMPGLADLSWEGANNAKLVDSLSPIARAYNNVLAMLIATVGLAIPLTANMHTPKLIDLFLRDRVNQAVLILMALGAANVLFVAYLVGPKFAPMWAYRGAVYGALLGWVVLIPYFFYVVRFLDPSNIIARLQGDALEHIVAARGGFDAEKAQTEVQERLFQIGTIVIKAIDRADRSVALEGIWSLKRVVDGYFQVKSDMPPGWFHVDKGDFPGMSSPALGMLTRKRTWLEMHSLYQLWLCYHSALVKAPDVVSAISNVNRIVATRAAARNDKHAVSLCIRFFNTFLREALNRRDQRAAFDIFYQYRQMAGDLCEHPDVVRRIGDFFVTYVALAEQLGVDFVSQVGAYDLEQVMEQAYLADNPSADEVLGDLLGLDGSRSPSVRDSRIRSRLIAAGFFLEREMKPQLERIERALAEVSPDVLRQHCEHLVAIEKRQFWEITDRAVNIEWTPKPRRKLIQRFVESLESRARESAAHPS
jgi:predicted membrane protein DUF2254